MIHILNLATPNFFYPARRGANKRILTPLPNLVVRQVNNAWFVVSGFSAQAKDFSPDYELIQQELLMWWTITTSEPNSKL